METSDEVMLWFVDIGKEGAFGEFMGGHL